MKKIIILLTYLSITIQASAQRVTEWQILNDTLYIEISNPETDTIKEVRFSTGCDTTFTLTSIEIENINQNKPLSVTKIATTRFVNPSCYDQGVTICIDGQCSRKTYLESCENGYSWSFISSVTIQESKFKYLWNYDYSFSPDIFNLSHPSIGVPNILDSVLANIHGQLLDAKGMPMCNQLFYTFRAFVEASTGDTILRTNSEGYYDLVKFPSIGIYCQLLLIDSVNIESPYEWTYSQTMKLENEGRLFYISYRITDPENYQMNFKQGDVTGISSAFSPNIGLTLSPNPAKESVIVRYELPTTIDYNSYRIVLVSTDGHIVLTESLIQASGSQSISLIGIPQGLYRCIIRSQDGAVIGSENILVN